MSGSFTCARARTSSEVYHPEHTACIYLSLTPALLFASEGKLCDHTALLLHVVSLRQFPQLEVRWFSGQMLEALP